MSSKMEFVEKASKPGARMAPLCREYGISRETGYKWLKRYQREGPEGLEEHSRRPSSSPLARAEDLVQAVLQNRLSHPRWGSKKLQVLLRRRFGRDTPSRSTITRILRRFGQIRERRARPIKSVIEKAPTIRAASPNEVWTVDFKGWWKALDGERCEPLTIRDGFSRFLLAIRVMETAELAKVREEFEAVFKKYGLPTAIQCDNGPPFIHVRSRGGLTRLSAWWVSLGIKVIRSRPGCPQDNGGHERMHRDMSADLQAFPARSAKTQQLAIDRWRQEFNHVRPHEALGGKVPADLYKPSANRRLTPSPFAYPTGWILRVPSVGGVVSIDDEKYNISRALAGQLVGFEPLGGLRHRIWFRDLDLGELELSVPHEIVDEVAQAFLEKPFSRNGRRIRTRNDSLTPPGPQLSPSAVPSQATSLPPGPPSPPPLTCAQQTLGSSAVSSAATLNLQPT